MFLLVLFGALLDKAGAGKSFIDVTFSALGGFRGSAARDPDSRLKAAAVHRHILVPVDLEWQTDHRPPGPTEGTGGVSSSAGKTRPSPCGEG